MSKTATKTRVYPRAVCDACSISHGGLETPVDGTSWMAHCDICWEFRTVADPQKMGYPVFRMNQNQIDRLNDNG